MSITYYHNTKLNNMTETLDPNLQEMSEEIYRTVKPRIKDKQFKLTNFQEFVEEKIKKTYPQEWWAYNEAQTREKVLFLKILRELCDTIQIKSKEKRKSGRPSMTLPEKIYALGIYCYTNFSSRRSISDLNIIKNLGLLPKAPHFNSILNYLAEKSTTPIISDLIVLSSLPLKSMETDFCVDATGFSTPRFERWFNIRTQENSKKRQWKKAHCIVGKKSNIITSVLITDGVYADSPYLKPLVEQTRKYFDMKEVSADKGYLSRENLQTISEMGAVPYIPFKVNSTGNSKGVRIWRQMYEYFTNHREDFDAHYHKRSNVETTYSMIKRKFSNNLKSRRTEAQVNEFLMKCLCHNICCLIQESIELGLEIDLNFCAETFFAQKQG
jgi:transposase